MGEKGEVCVFSMPLEALLLLSVYVAILRTIFFKCVFCHHTRHTPLGCNGRMEPDHHKGQIETKRLWIIRIPQRPESWVSYVRASPDDVRAHIRHETSLASVRTLAWVRSPRAVLPPPDAIQGCPLGSDLPGSPPTGTRWRRSQRRHRP